MILTPFKGSGISKSSLYKLNELVRFNNSLQTFKGDGLIKVRQTDSGILVYLDIDAIQKKLAV